MALVSPPTPVQCTSAHVWLAQRPTGDAETCVLGRFIRDEYKVCEGV